MIYNQPDRGVRSPSFTISYMTPAKRLQAKSEDKLLTKPSSWIKLIVAVLVLGWGLTASAKFLFFNKPAVATNSPSPASASANSSNSQTSDSEGKVAGAQSSTIDKVDKSEIGGNETDPNSKTTSAPDVTTPPPNYHQDRPAVTVLSESELANLDSSKRIIAQNTDPKDIFEGGLRLLNSGNVDLARYSFERATKLEPYWRDAWYLLGYALASGDNPDFPAAKTALKTATSIDPLDKQSWQLIIKIGDFTADTALVDDAKAHLEAIK